MNDERNTQTLAEGTDEKLPYAKPILVEYGKVQELTRGTSGSSDGASGGRGGRG